jgi:CRP/FNR family transcriptional regulator, cyclic AMP receptor protein
VRRMRKVREDSMVDNRNQSSNRGAYATTPISPAECVDLLVHIPLFAELSKRELRRIAGAAVQRDYPAGTMIVEQGETGVGLYVLVKGLARVEKRLADGSIRQLALLGHKELFGEMALLDTSPRSASVFAIEDTSALVIPIFDFRALLHDDADIAIKLLAVLSRRVRNAELAER